MRAIAATLLLLAALAFSATACSKIPSDDLCLSACKKYVQLTGDAKRQALARLPKEYKDKFDAKLDTDGKAIIDACVARCKVDGSVAAAECLVEAKTSEDLGSCRNNFGQP
jgi:hypothetical protein